MSSTLRNLFLWTLENVTLFGIFKILGGFQHHFCAIGRKNVRSNPNMLGYENERLNLKVDFPQNVFLRTYRCQRNQFNNSGLVASRVKMFAKNFINNGAEYRNFKFLCTFPGEQPKLTGPYVMYSFTPLPQD